LLDVLGTAGMPAIATDFDNILICRIAAMFAAICFSVAYRTNTRIVSAFVIVFRHKIPPGKIKNFVVYDNKQL
jgi:hypothetical protein